MEENRYPQFGSNSDFARMLPMQMAGTPLDQAFTETWYVSVTTTLADLIIANESPTLTTRRLPPDGAGNGRALVCGKMGGRPQGSENTSAFSSSERGSTTDTMSFTSMSLRPKNTAILSLQNARSWSEALLDMRSTSASLRNI